jgi:hypothetical protein
LIMLVSMGAQAVVVLTGKTHTNSSLVECADGKWWSTCLAGNEPVAPSDGLIQITDLNYLGGFRIPSGQFGADPVNSTANYSYGAMGFNSTNNSIYLAGHEYGGAIAEFTIPAIVNSTVLTDLNIAANPLQNFTNVTAKDTFDMQGGQAVRVAGMYENNNKLMVTAYSFYAQAAVNTTFLIFNDADNYDTSAHSGYLPASNGSAAAGGGISPIPAEWQSALGGTHLSGLSNSTARASTQSLSRGPAAFVLNADDALTNYNTISTVTTTPLINYTLANPLRSDAQMAETGSMWTHVSEMSFGMIVPGTDTYIAFGEGGGWTSGIGYKITQENGYTCGGWCPYVSTDYDNHYWLYDVNDMLAVKNGTMQAYEIEPYDHGVIDVPFQTGTINQIAGGAYDAANGILYLTLFQSDTSQGGGSNPPVIVAYDFSGVN